MKKFLLVIALTVGVMPAFAQVAVPAAKTKQIAAKAPKTLAAPEQRAISYSKELKQKLSLSDDQYTKVLAVNTECIRRKDALKTAGQDNTKGRKEISAYRQQQYQGILTPQQQAQLKAMNAQNAQHAAKKAVADPLQDAAK